MKVQRCKGFNDLSVEDMKRFRLIEETFRNICLRWGYDEVRTPTLEYMHLFTSTGTFTPSLLNKVYSFLDWDGWSGERVVLRPDGTIPIARLYVESLNDKDLAKLFYITNIFIFEETGTANREKWQGGVELIGAGSPLSDVELISMAIETLHELKLENIELKLSHAGIIKALLSELGMSYEEQTKVFDKILDGDISTLEGITQEKSAVGKTISSLLKLKGKSSESLKNIKSLYGKEFRALSSPLQDFIEIVELLETAGINYQIDIDTGRGFEYYTGIIFHIFINGTGIGGGGRYNALIPFMGGKKIAASGFALYFDTLMTMVSRVILTGYKQKKIMVRLENHHPALVHSGLELIRMIHSSGIRAEIALVEHLPVNVAFVVDIKKDHTYVLSDLEKNETKVFRNAGEIMKLIKNERTDKSSPA